MIKNYTILKIAYFPPFSNGMLIWIRDTITPSATTHDESTHQYNLPFIHNEIYDENTDTHFFTGHDELLMDDLIKKDVGYIEF